MRECGYRPEAFKWRNRIIKAEVEDNRIIDNKIAGIQIDCIEGPIPICRDPSQIAVHDNLFQGNDEYAIDNENKHAILNATNNDWGLDLFPGSQTDYDLRDPKYRDVLANGTGGAVSEGVEPGVSNVHFYIPGPEEGDAPSAPTATPTVTPTDTESGDDGDGDGDGNGNGSGDGDGSGGGSGDNDGNGDGDGDGDESSEDEGSGGSDTTETSQPNNETPPPQTTTMTPPSDVTATEPPTVTATEPGTATPMLPLTPPTPMPEPGFGVGAGVAGVALLFGILALKRRE